MKLWQIDPGLSRQIPASRSEDSALINHERIKHFLIELIKIDSLSRQELNVALRLKRELEELGA